MDTKNPQIQTGKKMKLDILIITYQPSLLVLARLFESLKKHSNGKASQILIWDNTSEKKRKNIFFKLIEDYEQLNIKLFLSDKNTGFGFGVNQLLDQSKEDFLLILNQDTELLPNSIEALCNIALLDHKAAAWECRQLPYEHPKVYNPSTLETPWVTCAACLLRRSAFVSIGGFDKRIFMYAEDVDMSWRLRARGWKLRYVPQAAVLHTTYAQPDEIKPLQAIEGTLNNLCLRARFGSWFDIFRGLLMLIGEWFLPQDFSGRRLALIKVLPRFLIRIIYFRFSGRHIRQKFSPTFIGWNYAIHREGAFYHFEPLIFSEMPLVSILVRTRKRPSVLLDALKSIRNQTYPNIEVIVVEDGEASSRSVIKKMAQEGLNITYHSTGYSIGRSRAGNIALSMAKGEWLGFLDDDDQIFSDHVEVLVKTATYKKVLGVYALAWEVRTDIKSWDPWCYNEKMHQTIHHQPFSRIILWHHNYLPIQSVLFHRSLYEHHGGFNDSLDQLEDWNLWVRYSLNNDFFLVEKTTSKYRIPAGIENMAKRQKQLDDAYAVVAQMQDKLPVSMTVRQCREMAEEFCRSQSVLIVTKGQTRSFIMRFSLSRWAFLYRGLLRRLSRRR